MSKDEKEQYECSECGTIINEDDTVCPTCGAELVGEDEYYELECSECGEKVKEADSVCPKCGAVLDEIEDESEIVTLSSFQNEMDATLALQYLSENEIEGYISSSPKVFYGSLTTCSISVLEKDLEKAKKILSEVNLL